MNQAGYDHEAQRELEQRALRNVSWLARKLGYQDALDRRQEKVLMIGMGVALVAIVAGLMVSASWKSSDDEASLVWQRCSVAARVKHVDDIRRIAAKDPTLTKDQLEKLVQALIYNECGRPESR
jgi:hypothetical protein